MSENVPPQLQISIGEDEHEPPIKRAPTVALLLGALAKDQSLLPGAAAAARLHGANLICVVGKNLNWPQNYLYQGNILYQVFDPHSVDGVVTWAGTGVALGQNASEAEMDAFFKHLAPLPIVNYEKPIPGLHSIRTDTGQAMKSVLRHLISVHQRYKILLIRGPKGHFETEERVHAYKNILNEFGLPIDDNLILPPIDWVDRDHKATIEKHLNQRGLRPGLDFDAIAGTEFYLANRAIEIIQSRGLNVPQDVAVVGFNENPENLAIHPPLTTVRKPFYLAGFRAVETVLDLAAGKPVAEEILIPGELILRQSCGCVSQSIIDIGMHQPLPAMPEPASSPEDGWNAFQDSLASESQDLAERLTQSWGEQLWDSFNLDISGITRQTFINLLNNLVLETADVEDHLAIWNRVLTRLRAAIIPTLAPDSYLPCETLLQQGRLCITEAGLQAHYRQTVEFDSQRVALDIINLGLSSINDLDDLIESLWKELPRMKAPSCYLSLYVDGEHPEQEARLILAYCNYQRIPLDLSGRIFPSRQWVPPELLPQGRNYTLIVEPLFFRQRQMGFIVFEIGQVSGALFETLQGQICSALERLVIEQEIREREARFHAMADSAPVGIVLVEASGHITYANPIFQIMAGPSHSIRNEDNWFKPAEANDSQRIALKWQEAAQNGLPFHDVGRYLNVHGEKIWLDVRMTPILVQSTVLGYVGMTLDITEQLQSQEMLKESEERYRLMIDAQAEGVGFIDAKNNFLFMNPAGESIFGVPGGSLVGRNLSEFIDEAQTKLFRELADTAEPGDRNSFEFTIKTEDGDNRHLIITIAPSFDTDHIFRGSFGVFRDISERKRLEDRLYYLSMRDTMTTVFNRAYFEETLLTLQYSDQFPVSVIILDLDGLKSVNDTLGHAAGDDLIRRLARLLKNSFRSDDVIARIGGDEFAVVLPGGNALALQESIHRLQYNLMEENQAHTGVKMSFSMGGATAKAGDDLKEVVKLADQAMYQDKARFKIRV
jgi:diguanylate cyclase (GGDEF)-like protein/PAS domain S-box-containing protein